MINPIMLYTAGGSVLLGLVLGWTVRDWKADSDALDAVKASHKAQIELLDVVAEPSADLENTIANLRTTETETRNTIKEVYRNVEVPANCAVPADAVRVLVDAVRDANAAAAGELGARVQDTAAPTAAADRP